MKRKDLLNQEKNLRQQELQYDYYQMSGRELTLTTVQGLLLVGVIVYTFYRNIYVYIIVSPLSILFVLYQKRVLLGMQMRTFQMQFKEGIISLAASLRAGYALENAVAISAAELYVIYGESCMIAREFIHMGEQVKLNRSIEELMLDFGERSKNSDITNFAKVLVLAKRSGGELVPIINHTVEVIKDKIQVEEEIYTMTASKQFEQKIMRVIPFLIIFYLNTTSPGFFDLMYETAFGNIVMTVFLIIYIFACWLSKKILDIEV